MSSSHVAEHKVDNHSILVVDDNPNNLGMLSEYLKQYGYRVLIARSGDIALKRLEYFRPDIVLLDVMMPGIDGFETCRQMKANERTREIPVIFMTALSSEEHKIAGFDAGGVDYVTKPVQHEEVMARVETHLRIATLTQRLQAQNERMKRLSIAREISTEISQQITSILDLSILLDSIVELIQSSFDYYFVGVWLLDKRAEHVMLQASAVRGGTSHAPEIQSVSSADCKGIVARVCTTRRHHLAHPVHEDPYYVDSEKLPYTCSELVLPLAMGGEIFGALDIQWDETSHLDLSDEVLVLQSLANQVATAIRNARLYDQVIKMNEQLEQTVEERTEELRMAIRHLKHLDEAKLTFIQVASHELLTPMNAVVGCLSLLGDSPRLMDEDDKELFEGANEGAAQMIKIINAMIRVSEIDSDCLQPMMAPVWLYEVIRSVIQRFQSALEERHLKLTTMGFADLPTIVGDARLLADAFSQVVGNAIKYTPDGGRIRINARVHTRAGRKYVDVLIADQGIGIDAVHFELIFQKFYQTGVADLHSSGETKFKGGGPGLGLPLAKGIINAHDGRIWVESDGYDENECPGSQFHIALPITE